MIWPSSSTGISSRKNTSCAMEGMPTMMSLAPFTASATELVAMANSPLPMRRKPYLVCVPGALSCRVMPVRITVPSAPSKNGSRSQMRTSWPASAQSAPHVLPTAPPPSTAMGALRNSSTLTNSTTSYFNVPVREASSARNPALFNTQENAWGRLARRAPRRSSNTKQGYHAPPNAHSCAPGAEPLSYRNPG